MSNTAFLILSLLGFILLVYNLIILIKRKEYESNRVLNGYNVLIFGVFLLVLTFFIKFIKYLIIEFSGYFGLLNEFLGFFDLMSNVFLLTLFSISFLVGVFIFKEI
ncbi:hypothetical protein HYV88_03070 [Candidatus Woesearchaeota archaeon]|nr:hypothetical protein [Candidatus Woesearchaeota archaeon]